MVGIVDKYLLISYQQPQMAAIFHSVCEYNPSASLLHYIQVSCFVSVYFSFSIHFSRMRFEDKNWFIAKNLNKKMKNVFWSEIKVNAQLIINQHAKKNTHTKLHFKLKLLYVNFFYIWDLYWARCVFSSLFYLSV